MTIQANVTNQQITASVTDTAIDVSVSGGVGTDTAIDVSVSGGVGPTGAAGATGATGPAGSNATATTSASDLVSGTLSDSRLSANVVLVDGTGKVPASKLPSYVDDVLEAANVAALPATGETGKIYTTLNTNKIYRWSGSAYIEISPSPGSTDAVPEGSTNLYYTTIRAASAAPVQSVAGRTGAVTLTRTDIGGLGTAAAASSSDFVSSQSAIVNTTLLLHFDEGTIVDSSNNNYAATTDGDVSIDSATVKFGAGSLSFFSAGSVWFPAGCSVNGNEDFTVEMWLSPNNIFGTDGDYYVPLSNDEAGGLSIVIDSDGHVWAGRSLIGDNVITTNAVAFGQWNHVAVCRKSGTSRIFINGQSGAEYSSTPTYASGAVRLGSDGGGGSLFFDGYMDELRIVRGSGLYTSNFMPPSLPFTTAAVSAGNVLGLATVATTGSYNDLSNKPNIPATYTLPAATTSTLGGVIVGSGLTVSSGTVAANVTSVAGRTGAVTLAVADVTGAVSSSDSRLSDARTPTSHTHGNVTNAGAIGSTSGQIVVTTTSGVLTTVATISASSVSGLASSATTDCTNASNISTGTLSASLLPTSGVTAGTYTSVTVDNKGRVTAGTSPSGGVKLGLVLALT